MPPCRIDAPQTKARWWARDAPPARLLKTVRSEQLSNRIMTSTLRGFVGQLVDQVPEVIVRHLPRVAPVRFSTPTGRRMVFAPQGYDALASAIFWHGLGKAEPDACVFHRLARRATVICDVGAHLGIYALLASDANPASIVIALEPLPRVFARLALNIEANRMENVLCLPVAAGDADAIQDFFYVPMTALQSSSGLDRAFFSSGPNAEELEALPVAVARVDTLVGAIGEIADGRLDLIKIDTEGTEPSVLRGMGSILGNCRPQILCEVLPHTGTGPMIEEILAPHGYRFFHLTPDGPIERDTPIGDPSRVSRNYLCIATDVERALADARQVYFGGAPSWEGKIT